MPAAIHQSENLLVIRLKEAQLEDIVERKLIHILNTDSSPLPSTKSVVQTGGTGSY